MTSLSRHDVTTVVTSHWPLAADQRGIFYDGNDNCQFATDDQRLESELNEPLLCTS